MNQHTLARPVEVAGVGLHGGQTVRVLLTPAPPDHGRIFVVDGVRIPATMDRVVDTRLATTLGAEGVRVGMVEHLGAALYATGVDNVQIEVEGQEVPVLDGSARLWMAALAQAGLRPQAALRPVLAPREALRVENAQGWLEFYPSDQLFLEVSVQFAHPRIGEQHWSGPLHQFASELCWARTFGFLKEAELLRASGLARGASLENTVVYDETSWMNPVRAPDEVVRHKALDLIGDLSLLGRPLCGHIRAYRAGHALHLELVRRLGAWA